MYQPSHIQLVSKLTHTHVAKINFFSFKQLSDRSRLIDNTRITTDPSKLYVECMLSQTTYSDKFKIRGKLGGHVRDAVIRDLAQRKVISYQKLHAPTYCKRNLVILCIRMSYACLLTHRSDYRVDGNFTMCSPDYRAKTAWSYIFFSFVNY